MITQSHLYIFIVSHIDYCHVLLFCTPDATRLFYTETTACTKLRHARYILNAQTRSPLPLYYSTNYIGFPSRVGYATKSAAWCTESTAILLRCPNYIRVPCTDSLLRSTARGNYVIPEHRDASPIANRAFAVATCSAIFIIIIIIIIYFQNK